MPPPRRVPSAANRPYNRSMAPPILATKLYIPPSRPKVVLRPRLVERLNEGLHHKLILISAPAGFGKTTLLSEWIHNVQTFERSNVSTFFSWLSLDEGDSDLHRFLAYLVAALQTLALNEAEGMKLRIGENLLAALQTPQPPPPETLLTSLANEIAALPGHFFLVLDDYHLLDSQPVDKALAFLLDHQPPRLHLVIASREDPSLPLPRLRARGQLIELRTADLLFTPAEAADFLNRVMGLDLTEAEIAALEVRTEGWIAGLQLAALSMQGQKDMAGFIQSFTGSQRFVLDYLLEEVLNHQPVYIQTFLLRTSILNRLCAGLCDAVLGDAGLSGQETLEALERANLFIVPLDQERQWYRYHHLFGDMLRQRLGKPQELPEYHLRASAWYEDNGDLAEAYHHALTAGQFERAARLAEAAWQDKEGSFQTNAWIGWVSKLPDTVVSARPILCVQLGWAFSDAGDPEMSEIHLQNAERALAAATDMDQSQSLPGSIALARAYNAQVQGKLADTVKYAELAIQLIPENDFYRRAQAAITLEFTHWAAGNLEASLRAIRVWIESMQKLGNVVFGIASAFAVADLLVTLGHLHEAIRTYQQALQLAAKHGQEAQQITAHHHLGLALIYHELGDDEAAAPHLQAAAELGKLTTLVDWPHRWYLAQAWLEESNEEWDAALEFLDRAIQVYVKNPVPILRPVEAIKARIYLKQGRLDRAQAWARERGLSVDGEISYLEEYEYLTLARVRLAEGSFAGISNLLERLLSFAEEQKRTGNVIEILLTQALAYHTQGYHPQALAALERALALAEPEGYLRIFVDGGESVRLLIYDFKLIIGKQSHAGVHPLLAYVNKILAAFHQAVAAIPQSGFARQKHEIIEPLSERELEILRLVAQGLSNAEISQRLYLALSTVKGHNLRIFAKLEVQNRTEAVARARELGLL